MAWIELHDTLPDHDKVADMAEMLKMDKDMVVGKLVRLWTWAINNRSDGYLKARDSDTLAEVMRYKGKPGKLIDALISVRMLDVTDDGYYIHDWEQYAGMLMAKRETQRAQNRARQQRRRDKEKTSRDRNADVTRDITPEKRDSNAVTVPIPYLTVPDDDEYIVIREQEHALRAALVDGAGDEVVREALSSWVDIELYRAGVSVTEREREDIMDYAISCDSAMVLCGAIAAASAARATAPVAYIKKCIDTWSTYRLDTPQRVRAAQSDLVVITNRRTSVSADVVDTAMRNLDEMRERNEEDPYGARTFNMIREAERDLMRRFPNVRQEA